MAKAHFTFLSTFENYEKEKSNVKCNHVVFDENIRSGILYKILCRIDKKSYGSIKIRKGYTKEFFIRELSDITYWKGVMIFSWLPVKGD